MQAAIDIPTPNESDSETVVTALETAAVFSAKGDTAEAIRWLQRAAESAGDAGDDARTLTLARTAAELSRSLQSEAPSEPTPRAASESATPKRLPKPPLRKDSALSAAPASNEDEAPATSVKPLDSTRTPLPSAVATSTRPPPPSTRVLPSTPVRPNSGASGSAGTTSVAPRASVLPAKSSVPTVERRGPSSLTPAPSSVIPRKPTEAGASRATAAAERPARTEPSSTEKLAASVSPTAVEKPAANGHEPVEPNGAKSGLSLKAPEQGNVNQRLRAAARVSVVPSSTEPGLFFVRVLDDGQPPPSSSTEALMVLLDPSSTLFSG